MGDLSVPYFEKRPGDLREEIFGAGTSVAVASCICCRKRTARHSRLLLACSKRVGSALRGGFRLFRMVRNRYIMTLG